MLVKENVNISEKLYIRGGGEKKKRGLRLINCSAVGSLVLA